MTSRALRLGVLIGDSLVEEKILDGAHPITLGQSLRCTLSVPVDGVPREHVLFTHADGRFHLHATADMRGRLAEADAIRELAAATFPLARGARGKLHLGDATILFQEIAKPAPAPRIQLPLAIRGTFADRIDRRLAAIIGGSLAIHIAIAAYAWSNDAAIASRGLPEPSVAQFEQARVELSLPEQFAQPTATQPTATQPGAAVPVAPHHVAPPIAHPMPHTLAPPPPSTDDALRLASILSSDETAQHGVGGMTAHRPGTGLERELEELQANHREVTIGDDGRGPRTTSTQIQRDHELPLDHAEHSTLDAPQELPSHGRVKLEGAHSDDKTTLTAQAVLDLINTQYMAGLQRCYRRGLSLDAQLSGTIAISFTVGENGHVTEPDAAGSDAQVDHCIQTLMGVWRFPIPRDHHGAPTDATLHISLALRPS